jgi:hypothetical protein
MKDALPGVTPARDWAAMLSFVVANWVMKEYVSVKSGVGKRGD